MVQLLREGLPALCLEGEQLCAELATYSPHGDAQNRYHEVNLYSVDGGGFVAGVVYRSRWQGESDLYTAYQCAEASALFAELQSHDPTEGFVGRPERTEAEAQFARPHNQAKKTDLRRRWARLLSEAASALGVTEQLGRHPGGRPASIDGPSTTLAVRVPDTDIIEVDRLRGDLSRSEWVRALIRERVGTNG